MFSLDSRDELLQWEQKIQKRVIKKGIWSEYKFLTLLGEGASGKVFLANKIVDIPNQDED